MHLCFIIHETLVENLFPIYRDFSKFSLEYPYMWGTVLVEIAFSTVSTPPTIITN
jgi:hypothetical protein